jgi:two-component system cell cycle response regulator
MSIPRHIMECADPVSEMSDKSKEKQRLLIVDDSKVIRVTARKILRDHFDIIEAVDGENAWEVLCTDAPVSLVVSDLTMPKLDGFGLLKRIRNSQLPHVRELPVIIITGANDTEATMAQARQVGATDFIGKPFDSVHLLARTQAHANSHAVTNTLMKENTALEERTTTDPLTGLANEGAFMERGYQQLSYSIRHNQSLTVFRIEIDSYGTIHRRFGGTFSKSIIQTLAKILSTSIRQEDTLARIGTARFALLLPGMDKAGIQNLAERIKSSVSTRVFKSGNDKANLTVSIGVASPEIRRDMRLSELIAEADEHLSLAISGGGDQVIHEVPARTSTATRPDQSRQAEHASNTPARVVFLDKKLSTAARSADLFHGDDMEVEEIEIFSPGFQYNHFNAAHNNVAEATQSPSATTPGHVTNAFTELVPEDNTVAPASDAMHNEHGVPKQMPSASTSTANTLTEDPGAAAETGMPLHGDAQDAGAVPALPGAEYAPDRFEETVIAEAIPMPAQVKNRRGSIKRERRTRPPGMLKRMLAWLGLMR